MKTIDIIEKELKNWLKKYGYKGLCNNDDGCECSCDLGDLMPCGEIDNYKECEPFKELKNGNRK